MRASGLQGYDGGMFFWFCLVVLRQLKPFRSLRDNLPLCWAIVGAEKSWHYLNHKTNRKPSKPWRGFLKAHQAGNRQLKHLKSTNFNLFELFKIR